SLELEPRDPMGIRWGRAALTARRLGRDATVHAWRAIQRGVWGAACILDNPEYGGEFGKTLAARLSTFRIRSGMEVAQAWQAASALAEHGVLPLTLPRLPELGNEVSDALRDGLRCVDMQIASHTAGAADVIASHAGCIDQFLGPRLHALGAMADSLGRNDVLASIAPRLRSVWSYRNKNDEDLRLSWWLAKASDRLHQPDQVSGYLDRLDAMDPANPWILELRGDVLRELGEADAAKAVYGAALRAVSVARLDPFFSSGPRELYTPAGDQWSYAFERAFRRYDDEAHAYHEREWNELAKRLESRTSGNE
ncbi:MAG TPA: hypothetical protein PKM25_12720, partial [Candidatus Ozemobacteraceae bacterium]|nr:hypothetical protein [Candidatus Ozemobacteraceae bacterium]